MTCSTSAEAVCCCSASRSSRFRRVRSDGLVVAGALAEASLRTALLLLTGALFLPAAGFFWPAAALRARLAGFLVGFAERFCAFRPRTAIASAPPSVPADAIQ